VNTADLNVTLALTGGAEWGLGPKNEATPLRSAAACLWLTGFEKTKPALGAGLTFERESAQAAGRADQRMMLSIR
jgi:hypothetical protein